MTVRTGGCLPWLWRAVHEHGQTLDVLRQERRDTAAAERFFRRLLDVASGAPPARITTDTFGSDAAALARLPALRATMQERVAIWHAVAGLRAA